LFSALQGIGDDVVMGAGRRVLLVGRYADAQMLVESISAKRNSQAPV
jgi:hypothetical protein